MQYFPLVVEMLHQHGSFIDHQWRGSGHIQYFIFPLVVEMLQHGSSIDHQWRTSGHVR
jgi:hypothetical protein